MYGQTYLLTPWSRVLLEKLTGSQLVKKFLTFYGTRRFITAFTTDHHVWTDKWKQIRRAEINLQ
jgi:hypothetical protein